MRLVMLQVDCTLFRRSYARNVAKGGYSTRRFIAFVSNIVLIVFYSLLILTDVPRLLAHFQPHTEAVCIWVGGCNHR